MTHKPTVFGRAYTGLVMLFLYAPIFILIVFSFNESRSRAVWAGFTFDWYVRLFQDQTVLNSLYTTLAVSVIAAAVATIAGTCAAVGLFNMRRRWRGPLTFVNSIPMINAEIITGVGMCLLFVTLGAWLKFRLGFGTLLIAHITFNIPYVILSVTPKLRQLDGDLLNAARDLGCTWYGALRKVILPEIKPGIVNGAMIAFTMSIDDFVISYFTAGSGAQTLSMTIYSMTRKQISPTINALSTLLFLSVLTLLLIVNIREARQDAATARRGKL